MGKKVGIDLGTTLTLASFINSAGKPELIPSVEGSFLTPSVVWIKGGTVEVGEAALNMALAEPEFLAAQMKRNMGEDSYTFEGLTATEVAAYILRKVKSDAEAFFNGEPVDSAAITVPAYFTDAPLKATKQAGELAGMEVLALPKEPTAAALYYGTAQMKDGEKLMVWDIGGGTTDATVLAYSASSGRAEFTILSSDGSRDLGGEDWTGKLFDIVTPAFEDKFGVPPRSDRCLEQALIDSCERAKRALTSSEVARVVLAYRGKTLSVPVTREEFEDATRELLGEAMLKARGALEKSGFGWGALSRVLLVGGASRMPMVARGIRACGGPGPSVWGVPDQLVALGAALYTTRREASGGGVELVAAPFAGGLSLGSGASTGLVISLRESTSHGLGTLVVARNGGRTKLVSSVIIQPRTEIPARGTRADYLTRPRQTEIDVPVVQVDEDGLDPASCVVNKTYRFLGVPDRTEPSSICVTFHYDKDNMIDVEAIDVASGRALEKTVIEFSLPGAGASDLRVVLVLDTSISMEGEPLDQLKTQVKEVCNELEDRGCEAGVVEFGAAVRVVCPPTDDFARVRKGVESLYAGGSTPMAEGLSLTTGALRGIEGNSVAILVSDGCPNSQPDARREATCLKDLGVTLYTISIGTAGADFLRTIGEGYSQIQSAGKLADAIGKLLWSK